MIQYLETRTGAHNRDEADERLLELEAKATAQDLDGHMIEQFENVGANRAAWLAYIRGERVKRQKAEREKIDALKRDIDVDEAIARSKAYEAYAKKRGLNPAHVKAVMNG